MSKEEKLPYKMFHTLRPEETIPIREQSDMKRFRKYKNKNDNTYLKIKEKFPCDDRYNLLRNPCIEIDKKTIKKEGYMSYQANPSITPEELVKNLKIPSIKLSTYMLCNNPNLTWSFIVAHPELDWDFFNEVSRSPCITAEIVNAHPELDWRDNSLACRLGIYRELKDLRCSDKLTWELSRRMEKEGINVDYFALSQNPNITLDIVKKNLDKPWELYVLCKNPSMEWADVVELCRLFKQEIPNTVSLNPNITYEIVVGNPHVKWDSFMLLRNQYYHDLTVCRKQYKKAVEKRRGDVRPILGKLFYKVLVQEIEKYISFD